jgi:hypothetical protein
MDKIEAFRLATYGGGVAFLFQELSRGGRSNRDFMVMMSITFAIMTGTLVGQVVVGSMTGPGNPISHAIGTLGIGSSDLTLLVAIYLLISRASLPAGVPYAYVAAVAAGLYKAFDMIENGDQVFLKFVDAFDMTFAMFSAAIASIALVFYARNQRVALIALLSGAVWSFSQLGYFQSGDLKTASDLVMAISGLGVAWCAANLHADLHPIAPALVRRINRAGGQKVRLRTA